MASVKISALPLATAVAATDLVVVVADPSGAPTTKKSLASTLPVSDATQTALDLKAPLASPALTSIPTAPTASVDTSTTQLATCAFVVGQAGNTSPSMDGSVLVGTSLRYARQDHVHPSDTSRAPIASPTFTGTVTIPVGASIDGYAQLANPVFTGQPTAPTASVDTSTTQLATCQFVVGQASNATPVMDSNAAAIGTSLRYARQDHVHPTDTSLASISNPTFTGEPAAPTAPVDTSTTQLATCAFVVGQAGSDTPLPNGTAAAGTSLRYARQDHVHATDASGAPLNSPAFTGIPTAPTASAATNTDQIATTAFVRAEVSALVGTAAATLDTLGELADALGSDAAFSTTIATSLGLKAPLASPTFTGTVGGITKAMVGLTSVDDTADTAKPVSTAQQTALDLKANLASPTFTGTVTIPSGSSISGFAPLASPTFTGTVGGITKAMVGLTSVDDTSDTAKPVSTATQTALDLKANLASPTFTGTVGGITKTMVGLGSVDDTADTAKPVSTAQQTALDLKANLASPTFTGTVGGITKTMVGLGSVDNTADTAKPVSTATQTALDLKSPLASPTFTGTVGGITKAMVGLTSVDDTSDTAKPVSTAQQTALDLKANLASPTFTGTVSGITKAMVGLGSVDNTADTAKPVSTATQTALDLKANLASPTFTGTVGGITKTMVGLGSVDNTADTAKPVSTAQQTALDLKANLASPTFTGIVTTAGQIAFPSTANISGNVNTLDDYERGSWTPTFIASTTNPTVTYDAVTYGIYLKIGLMVFISGSVVLTAASGGSGNLQIGGLPFVARNGTTGGYGSLALGYRAAWTTTTPGTAYVQASASYIQLYTTLVTATITTANLSATSYIQFSGFYRTTA